MPRTRPAKKTTPEVQQLEDRCTPALLAVLNNNALAAFNPNLPSASLGTPIHTLTPGGELIVAMDLRPGTTLLYGIAVNPNGNSDVGTLVSLDLSKGNALWTQVPTVGAPIQLFNGTLGGGGSTVVDTAWNPSTGNLQIIDDAGDSYEYNPATSTVSQDAFISAPLAGIAYANGTLYGYEESPGGDKLVTVNTFTGNTTVVNNIRAGGFNQQATNYYLTGLAGDGAGHIYANININGTNELWQLGLTPGSDSTLLGEFAGNVNVGDITFIPDSLLGGGSGAKATGANLVRAGNGGAVKGLRVQFNEALNPPTAEAASNYILQVTRGQGKHRHKVTLSPSSIVYDPADDSVTLFFTPHGNDRSVTVTVLGGSPGGNATFTLPLPRHP